MIVFRIGDGRLQSLRHDTSGFAGHKLQNRQRFFGWKPLHLPHDLAHLLRGHAEILGDCLNLHGLLFGFGFRRVSTVFFESAGKTEFTQLVANHVFGDKNRIENLAIVNVERQSNELWRDCCAARPSLNRGLGFGPLGLVDLALQTGLDVRPLL